MIIFYVLAYIERKRKNECAKYKSNSFIIVIFMMLTVERIHNDTWERICTQLAIKHRAKLYLEWPCSIYHRSGASLWAISWEARLSFSIPNAIVQRDADYISLHCLFLKIHCCSMWQWVATCNMALISIWWHVLKHGIQRSSPSNHLWHPWVNYFETMAI